jgi:hypothetical protein
MREAGPKFRNFVITYQWGGEEHRSVFPARSEAWARLLGPLQLMPDAEIVSVEEEKAA